MKRTFCFYVVVSAMLLAPFATRADSPVGQAQAARQNDSASLPTSQESASPARWQSLAKLHHGFGKASGTLTIDGGGIEFRPNKGSSMRWAFIDIQTLYILPRRIALTGYEKRGRLLPEKLVRRDVTLPGPKRFRFDLTTDLPPAVAAELTKNVARPVRNGDPQPEASSIATIPAHHRTALGGTVSNGTLRFREEGIDYLTKTPGDSRSWRWTDIQTLSNPSTYRLLVFGYLEIFTFDLKKPMTRDLFDRLTDEIYVHSVDGSRLGER